MKAKDKVESSSTGKDKFIPSGMGNKGSSGGTGPTGSSRTYSKGGGVGAKADFNPMNAGKSCFPDYRNGV